MNITRVQRVLVIGSNGLLGQKVAELVIRGSQSALTLTSIEPEPLLQLVSADYVQLDATVRKDVREVVNACTPDVIINCAAMTNVDACETEREAAWKVNVHAVENIVDAARKTSTRVVHVSSDYVFDGKSGPYAEDDRPEPLSYYGKSKLASENVLRTSGLPYFIARTMVLYGYAPGVKANFALWLIKSLQAGQQVRVVDDQWGNPTLVDDLAFGLLQSIELGKTGVFHLAGRDIVSRVGFAQRVAEVFACDPGLIEPIKTAQLKQPAPRPLRSGLVTLKAEVELGYRPVSVEQGLRTLKGQLHQARMRGEEF